jgi:Tfp pilus assembly protein PilW
MSKTSAQTKAKQAASAFIREAREAGWQRAKFEIKPDGSVIVDANMVASEAVDDFLKSNLRMGE